MIIIFFQDLQHLSQFFPVLSSFFQFCPGKTGRNRFLPLFSGCPGRNRFLPEETQPCKTRTKQTNYIDTMWYDLLRPGDACMCLWWIGLAKGLSPVCYLAYTWSNPNLSSVRLPWIHFIEICIKNALVMCILYTNFNEVSKMLAIFGRPQCVNHHRDSKEFVVMFLDCCQSMLLL